MLALALLFGCPPPPPPLPPPPPPPPQFDFGDAPDPAFPTLEASQGPRHTTVNQEWIGSNDAGDTTTEAAASVVDLDPEGAGPSVFIRIYAVSIPAPTIAAVAVTAAPPFDTPRFLNVFHDVDNDGDWSGGVFDEWIGRNLPIDFTGAQTLPNGNRRLWIQVPPFYYSDDNVLDPRWLRATVSREPLPVGGPTDGRGLPAGFTHGETEDHRVDLSNLSGPGPDPKDCVLRWHAVQNGAPTAVIAMPMEGQSAYDIVVDRVAGTCPDPLPGLAAPSDLFEFNLVNCRVVRGNVVGFSPGVLPVRGGPTPPVAVNQWVFPLVAKWKCTTPGCLEVCDGQLRYDPALAVFVEPRPVYFGVQSDSEPLCSPEELGDRCTADGRIVSCGDGRTEGREACDDGNGKDGDGCSSLCAKEQEGTVDVPPSVLGGAVLP